ncbi:MAG: hypothetical protein WDO70_04945 [Alphaproteobacteria bacterium]
MALGCIKVRGQCRYAGKKKTPKVDVQLLGASSNSDGNFRSMGFSYTYRYDNEFIPKNVGSVNKKNAFSTK